MVVRNSVCSPSGPDRPPAKKNPLLGGAGSTRGTQVKKSLFQESGDDGKTDQSAKKRPKREDDGGKGHHEPDGCGAAACSTPQGGMTAATETLEDWYETALKEVSGQDIVREVGEDFLWRTCTEEAVSEAKKVWTNQGQTKAMKTATEAVCGGVAFIKSRKEKWGEAAVSEALRKGGQAMAILHVKGLLDWAMGRKEVGKKMVHVLIKGVKELVSAWREVVNMTCLEGGEPLPAPMEKDLADIRRGLDDVEDKFESCLNAVSGRVYDEVYINAKITNATTGNNS